jgi:hypothetical protein
VVDLKPTPELEGAVECDEVYIVAGHKGPLEAVKKRRKGRCRRLKGDGAIGEGAVDTWPLPCHRWRLRKLGVRTGRGCLDDGVLDFKQHAALVFEPRVSLLTKTRQ